MKTEFSRQIFEKYTNMNFHENPSIVSLVVPCRLTDRWTDGRTAMKNLIVSFRDFANAPKNSSSNFGKKNCMKSVFLTDVNIKTMDFWYTASNNFSTLVPTFRRNLLLPSSMYIDNFKFYFNGKRRENNEMKKTKMNDKCCKLQRIGRLRYNVGFSSYDAAYT